MKIPAKSCHVSVKRVKILAKSCHVSVKRVKIPPPPCMQPGEPSSRALSLVSPHGGRDTGTWEEQQEAGGELEEAREEEQEKQGGEQQKEQAPGPTFLLPAQPAPDTGNWEEQQGTGGELEKELEEEHEQQGGDRRVEDRGGRQCSKVQEERRDKVVESRSMIKKTKFSKNDGIDEDQIALLLEKEEVLARIPSTEYLIQQCSGIRYCTPNTVMTRYQVLLTL